MMKDEKTKLGHGQLRIDIGEQSFTVDARSSGSHNGLSVQHVRDGLYSILYKGRSISAVFDPVDSNHFRVTVGDRVHALRIIDHRRQLLEEYGVENGQNDHANKVVAPMPGLVLKLHVERGSVVGADDPLLVLEAMKMENEIRAPGPGVVSDVHVHAGDAVSKGALLIEMDPTGDAE